MPKRARMSRGDTRYSRDFYFLGDQMERISKDQLYLNVADAVLGRATCLRRIYGAVIVKNDEIISTGYNGAPRGRKNCTDINKCKREELQVPQGQRYEICRSVHSEQNAIISAPRDKLLGSTLYLVGRDAKTGEKLSVSEPCSMCKRMIINAGIKEVVSQNGETIIHTPVEQWIIDDDSL